MIELDQLQRWRPENQESVVGALDREVKALVRFKESDGVRGSSWLAPVARRYLFLCADLDTVIAALEHVARAKRIAAARVRMAKAEAAAVIVEIEARGWTFTSEDDEVWVYDPAATWETEDELHQIQAELTVMAERLVAPLVKAYDANRELNLQTYAARRATSRLARPTSRRGRHHRSQRPKHVWSAHRSSHRGSQSKQSRGEHPGSETDGSA